nr:MsnO8 family LLM class oxidoreductase [Paenibacillus hamazuiensis]
MSVLDMVPILEGSGPEEALRQAALLAQTAERLGYSRYWTSEHHDMEVLASASPEVLLAHIGMRTSRIRIGSGAVLLPHYKPLKVAEAFHLLAALYPGRIDLGIGRAPGGSAHATMALNERFLEQVGRLPEALGDLTALLSHTYRIEGEPVIARPVPSVPPELWLLGTNVKSAKYAAEFGAGYAFGHFMSEHDGTEAMAAYRDGFRPSAAFAKPQTIVTVQAVCAETEDEARRIAAAGATVFGRGAAELPEEALAERRARLLAGTAEQVKLRLLELRERLGAEEFMIVTLAQEYGQRLRSYELLAKAVL